MRYLFQTSRGWLFVVALLLLLVAGFLVFNLGGSSHALLGYGFHVTPSHATWPITDPCPGGMPTGC